MLTFSLTLHCLNKNKTNRSFISMKHSELIRLLIKAGCLIKRHGASHDVWINPKTGSRAAVPRHGSKEIKESTKRDIFKTLLID